MKGDLRRRSKFTPLRNVPWVCLGPFLLRQSFVRDKLMIEDVFVGADLRSELIVPGVRVKIFLHVINKRSMCVL